MNDSMTKMHELVVKLNRYCDEYYNQHSPSVSDAAYDRLYDELETLEKQTGIQLSNSPNTTSGRLLNRNGIILFPRPRLTTIFVFPSV